MWKHSALFAVAIALFFSSGSGAAAKSQRPPPATAQELIEQLKSEDAGRREDAVKRLCRARDLKDAPVKELPALLDDDSVGVRKAVYASVRRFGELARPVAERLIAIVNDPDRAEEAQYGLNELRHAKKIAVDAAEPLLKAMADAQGDPLLWLSYAALGVGAKIPDELALSSYRKDPAKMDGWVVLWGEYCKSPKKEVIDLLRQQLRDGGEGWHLAQAANGLGQIGPAAAAGVPELIAALGNDIPHVRRYSARAIAMIGAAGEPALEKISDMAQNDPDHRVRQWTADAAKQLEAAIAQPQAVSPSP